MIIGFQGAKFLGNWKHSYMPVNLLEDLRGYLHAGILVPDLSSCFPLPHERDNERV